MIHCHGATITIVLSAIFKISLGLQLDAPPLPADFACNVIDGKAVSTVKGQAPKSFEEAIARPVDARSGDCFDTFNNSKIDTAQCCCPFWPQDAHRLKPVSSLMLLPATSREINSSSPHAPYDASVHGCVASFPFHSMNPPPHSFNVAGESIYGQPPEKEAEAGKKHVAVVVSGALADAHQQLDDSFQNVEIDIVNPLRRNGISADVFYHMGYRARGKIPTELPSWIKGLVLEAPSRGEDAVRSCTDKHVDLLINALRQRYPPGKDHAYKSTGVIHRHVFLAYRMAYAYAQEVGRDYQYVVRTRPDIKFSSAIDWLRVEQQLAEHPLLIGAQSWLFNDRKSGVEVPHRCAVDDQFAIGTMDAMGAYSTVVPDLRDFIRFVPFRRPDLNAHTNERLLTAHLHYRGVKFTDIPLDWKLHTLG
mmetsp:Transcript_76134/g.215754  ORF Transcript_76134/g.215754 Transcript_76134/m.215754 type:complete len:420 (+) Transcript_76134:90-1349(+)